MSELRRDPISGRWVVVAPERARAPKDFWNPRPEPLPGPCPFCPGQEAKAPHEIRAIRGDGGWKVRVVPSRLPVLRVEEGGDRRVRGAFVGAPGLGAHEVVIETPRHGIELAALSLDELTSVLTTWQERIRDLSQDVRLRSVAVFRHEGPFVGLAPSHAHSQVVALPFVPHERDHELAQARQVHEARAACTACEVLRQELAEKTRIVDESPSAVAFAPWASRVPFEVWVMPRSHASQFEREPASHVEGVARVLLSAAGKIDRVLGRPASRMVLHTAPLREAPAPYGDWRIELLPSLSHPTGLDASGVPVNPVAPETAAEWLRDAG